jgi:hypothetical protein
MVTSQMVTVIGKSGWVRLGQVRSWQVKRCIIKHGLKALNNMYYILCSFVWKFSELNTMPCFSELLLLGLKPKNHFEIDSSQLN